MQFTLTVTGESAELERLLKALNGETVTKATGKEKKPTLVKETSAPPDSKDVEQEAAEQQAAEQVTQQTEEPKATVAEVTATTPVDASTDLQGLSAEDQKAKIQKLAADLAGKGKKTEVHSALQKAGSTKLSEIAIANYPQLYNDLKASA